MLHKEIERERECYRSVSVQLSSDGTKAAIIDLDIETFTKSKHRLIHCLVQQKTNLLYGALNPLGLAYQHYAE